MEGIDWRALLVKVAGNALYFVPFFILGLIFEAGLDWLLKWRAGVNNLAGAWQAAWDSPLFGGKGEAGKQAWYYPVVRTARVVIGPLALTLAWRWNGSLLWLRLGGGLLLVAALYLVVSRTRHVTPAPLRPASVTDDAIDGEHASRLAVIAAGQTALRPSQVSAQPSATALSVSGGNIFTRVQQAWNEFSARAFDSHFDWLGLKSVIVLAVGGFLALIVPYQSGVALLGGWLTIVLLPLVGLLLPISGGVEIAIIVILASKGLSLGAGLAFILAAPLLYRPRLEEIELLDGRRTMLAFALVVWLLPVIIGLLLYFSFPDKLL